MNQAQHKHSRFLSMLKASDRQLMTKDLAYLCSILSSSASPEEEGLWTPDLADYIAHVDPRDLLSVEWATETHYAALMRRTVNREQLDYFYLIAYARVVSLMMMFEPHMGYSLDDLHFILTVLERLCVPNSQDVRTDLKVLEVGCGAGDLLIDLAKCGYRNIVGIDIAPAAIHRARRKLYEHDLAIEGLHCVSIDGFRSRFPSTRFDLVIHCHVIEHLVPTLTQPFLEQVSECLTTNGHMVVITPSKLTGPHDNTRYFKAPGATPEGFHMQEFTLADLTQLLSRTGFGRFMAMNSQPYANRYWDTISEANFYAKLQMEPHIASLGWKLKKPLVDGLYFQALVCQKLGDLS